MKDVGNVVADQFGAVRTPEVFLLDKDRVVRYWGRIDDEYIVGRRRDEPTRKDLALAILSHRAKGNDQRRYVCAVNSSRVRHRKKRPFYGFLRRAENPTVLG